MTESKKTQGSTTGLFPLASAQVQESTIQKLKEDLQKIRETSVVLETEPLSLYLGRM